MRTEAPAQHCDAALCSISSVTQVYFEDFHLTAHLRYLLLSEPPVGSRLFSHKPNMSKLTSYLRVIQKQLNCSQKLKKCISANVKVLNFERRLSTIFLTGLNGTNRRQPTGEMQVLGQTEKLQTVFRHETGYFILDFMRISCVLTLRRQFRGCLTPPQEVTWNLFPNSKFVPSKDVLARHKHVGIFSCATTLMFSWCFNGTQMKLHGVQKETISSQCRSFIQRENEGTFERIYCTKLCLCPFQKRRHEGTFIKFDWNHRCQF